MKPQLVRAQPAPAAPGAWAVAHAHADRAQQLLQRTEQGWPRYPWPSLDALAGPLRPGELHVFAATTGGGKSTFLTSMLRALLHVQQPVAYAPMETKPEEVLLQLAAFELGYDYRQVLSGAWEKLPPDARDQLAHQGQLLALGGHFFQLDGDQLSLDAIAKGVAAIEAELEHRPQKLALLVLDHFQQLTPEPINPRWLAIQQLARDLKNFAEYLGLPILLSAQLTRAKAESSTTRRLCTYELPSKEDIKEASAIAEAASVVITAARKLREDLTKQELAALRAGRANPADYAEPGIMQLSIEKHRLDGARLFARTELYVDPRRGVIPAEERPFADDPRA